MKSIFIFIIILQSLYSVLCLNCSDVTQSNGFAIFNKRDSNGNLSHLIYDKNGKEWQFFLTDSNGTIEISGFDNESTTYDNRMNNRFGNYMQNYPERISLMCYNEINSSSIVCDYTINGDEQFDMSMHSPINNPLILKAYPGYQSYKFGGLFVMYNRNNKSDRYFFETKRVENDEILFSFEIEWKDKRSDSKEWNSSVDIIRQMDDKLFARIDSILDYEGFNTGLTGHMVWFNIRDKYFYCFQPFGKRLSEQVFTS